MSSDWFDDFEDEIAQLKARQQKILNHNNTKARKKLISQKIKIGEMVQSEAETLHIDLDKLREFLVNHKGELMECSNLEEQ